MGSSLATLLAAVQEQLHSLAAGDRFWAVLDSAFGGRYKRAAATDLKRQWLEREFSQLPEIEVVAPEALAGAWAVSSSATHRLFLSRTVLQTSPATVVTRLLLEEIGHALDARLNRRDTPGDEGERFANAVLGIALNAAEQRRVATENDRAVILLSGVAQQVEKAEPLILEVTTLADENDGSATLGLGLSLRDAILFANNNPATDIEIRLAGGQTYQLRASGFHEDNARKGDLDIKARTGALAVVASGEDKAIINASNLSIGDRIFDVLENANLSLANLVLSGANCAGDGGALHIEEGGVLTVLNSEIKNNSSVSDGGAIYNQGTCRLERVSIHTNKASGYLSNGGGIYNGGDLLLLNSSVANNIGQGIYNSETLILIGSTISGNSKVGIYLTRSSAGLVNTTISGNQETGIDANNSAVTLTNCTVTDNLSDYRSIAGGIDNSSSSIVLRNTIVAGNRNNDDDGYLDLSGDFTGDANNLIGSLLGASGSVGSGSDLVTPVPGLGALAENGGPVRTHSLLASSPAINAGDNDLVILDDEDIDQDGDLTERIPVDGRGPGYARIQGGVVDIGAFETPRQPPGLPTISLKLTPGSIAEDGTGRLSFTFLRTGSTADPLTLRYTVSGTATPGVDTNALSPATAAVKTVNLDAGINTATVDVQPIADTSPEADETVTLRLVASPTYQLGLTTAATGTIINDDVLGTAANDSLTGSIYSDNIDGLSGKDVLTGREGADRFRFRAGHSTVAAPDRITDFVRDLDKISLHTAAGNKLPLPQLASRAADNGTATTLWQLATAVFDDADGALNGKQRLGANQVALVVATHPAIAGTYLLANDATAGLSPSNDTMIAITGSIGGLPPLGAFAPRTFFE